MFDVDTEKSILDVPGTNLIPASFVEQLKVGDQIIDLGEKFNKHIIDHEENVFLSFKSEHVCLESDLPSIKIRCTPTLIEERTNYKAVFAKIKNVNSYLVYKVSIDEKIELNKEREIYMSLMKE